MAEPISIIQRDNQSEQRPDRPRYEPPMVVHLGNSQMGRGGNFCGAGSGNQAVCAPGTQGPLD